MLRIPSLVNSPYTLLQYFKKSLLVDNIRPLTGPYVQKVLEKYASTAFLTRDFDSVQDGTKREYKRYLNIYTPKLKNGISGTYFFFE